MAFGISPSKKYPLYKMAFGVGDDLDEIAKGKRKVGDMEFEKDSFAFFGRAFGWGKDELETVFETKEVLSELIKNGVSRSLLQIIYSAYAEEKKNVPINRVWRFIYSLHRLARREGKTEEIKESILRLENQVIVQGFKLQELALYASRWCELETS